MQELISQEGRFPTDSGSRYLQQLCKHFAHKVEVEYDAHHGTVALPAGPARLEATEAELIVRVAAADADGLARVRGVIDSHLERFAFREGFKTMTWAAIRHDDGAA